MESEAKAGRRRRATGVAVVPEPRRSYASASDTLSRHDPEWGGRGVTVVAERQAKGGRGVPFRILSTATLRNPQPLAHGPWAVLEPGNFSFNIMDVFLP